MKKYFTLLSKSTQPKNNLQKEVWAYFDNLTNWISIDVDLDIVRITDEVHRLNQKHAKCQPLSVREQRHDLDGSISLYIRVAGGDQGPGLNVTFHLVLGEWK